MATVSMRCVIDLTRAITLIQSEAKKLLALRDEILLYTKDNPTWFRGAPDEGLLSQWFIKLASKHVSFVLPLRTQPSPMNAAQILRDITGTVIARLKVQRGAVAAAHETLKRLGKTDSTDTVIHTQIRIVTTILNDIDIDIREISTIPDQFWSARGPREVPLALVGTLRVLKVDCSSIESLKSVVPQLASQAHMIDIEPLDEFINKATATTTIRRKVVITSLTVVATVLIIGSFWFFV